MPSWMAYDMRLMSERFTTDGMVPDTGDVDRMTTLLGRPLHSYREFVTQVAASHDDMGSPARKKSHHIYSTATVPVNPLGETTLARAQAWQGLMLKARDARLLLPEGLCTRCDVVEESATHFA
jgi:hypothetical protein